jgi:hypothetical protein
MQAQHLYVVALLNNHDLQAAKKHETLASATSLYNKYQHKCGNVALVEVAPRMALHQVPESHRRWSTRA